MLLAFLSVRKKSRENGVKSEKAEKRENRENKVGETVRFVAPRRRTARMHGVSAR
jgi:hypothetical protein